MKKNKLILFDWGNIVQSHLIGYKLYDAYKDLFYELGYNGDDISKKLSKYYITTITNIDDFKVTYEDIKKDFNLKSDFNRFVQRYKYYFEKIDYYKNVRDYEVSLRDKCYIGIFSNLTIFDKEHLDRQVDLSKYDYVFMSCELGCRKPSMEIYEKVQSKLDFDKNDILFIDDRIDNVMAAKKFGWNVLQATGLELDKIRNTCEDFIKD